jgi:hypothetical protein
MLCSICIPECLDQAQNVEVRGSDKKANKQQGADARIDGHLVYLDGLNTPSTRPKALFLRF